MACIPIYPPRGLEILREHIRLARARCEVQDMAAPITYIWFYQRVRNGGLKDYKQKAGAAQWKAGTSREEWGNFMQGPPFGDDPIDQFWIKQGIDYAKQHHF